jgi:hypothetical protein
MKCLLLIFVAMIFLTEASSTFAYHIPEGDCIREYNLEINNISDSLGTGYVITFCSLGILSPITVPMICHDARKIKKYEAARNLILEANSGWGPTLDRLYSEIQSMNIQEQLKPADLVTLIKLGNEKMVFCSGKLARYSAIRTMIQSGNLLSIYNQERSLSNMMPSF